MLACISINLPVTGALRVAFLALLVLLIAGAALHHRCAPRPSAVLRAFAAVSTLVALTVMMLATDAGATDHELWSGVVAPIALTVFSVYAELAQRRPERISTARASRSPIKRTYSRSPSWVGGIASVEDSALRPSSRRAVHRRRSVRRTRS